MESLESPRNIVLFHHLKDNYGPIAQGIINTGVQVGSFKHDLSKIDKAILFCNDASVIQNLKKIGVHPKLGWWMCDFRPPDNLFKCDVDHIFLCNTEHIEAYKKKWGVPVDYMPQSGIDDDFPSEDLIDWEVLFIGNFSNHWHTNREEYMTVFKENFNFKIISGQYYTKNQKYLYKNTPISLAISPQARGYTSNRLYNILSSGGFCLTLWYPEIEKQFENKKHLVWFKTPQEAVDLARHYINHKDERDKIAREGLKLYRENHTARHRLEKMFALMK